jgi:iron(III) transport system permease protein
MDRVAPSPARAWSLPIRRVEVGTLACTLALAIVAFLVLYPMWLLILNSFQVGTYGQVTTWGLENWRAAFTDASLSSAIGNTVTLAVTRQALALIVAIPIAWLIARTDLPGRNWLEFGFWIAVFLPPLTALLGWILLFDGFRGIVNVWLRQLPFIQQSPFDIFSWWGIIFAHLVGTTLAIKIMLLTPAFRSIDASLEEASRAAGASTPGTLFRILVPLLAPSILVVTLLGLIHSLEAFEIELVLGAPANIDVYSTKIYRLMRLEPPLYGSATALSSLILVVLVPLILVQQWLVHRHSYVTVTGRYRTTVFRLGAWKWPAFAIIALLVFGMTVVPSVLVVMGSFMKVFGAFSVASPWTMNNWNEVFKSSGFSTAAWNTVILATATSVIAMVAFAVLAYISVRTRFFGRDALDFLTWIPSLLPGVVMGLGFLWFFLESPVFRPLYGTMAVLVTVVALSNMTRSVQMLKANLLQLGPELEEASRASGAAWVYTFRRILVPLMAPMLAAVGILVFASASRTASHVALLASSNTRPLSLMQLDYMIGGTFEAASVVGVIILLFTVGVALLARVFGLQVGPNRE